MADEQGKKYVAVHNIQTGKGAYARPGSVVQLSPKDADIAKRTGSVRDYDPEKDGPKKDAQKADRPGG